MNIITVTNQRHMTYNSDIKHNMQAAELRLNIINKNPNVINALDGYVNLPSIQNCRNIPFTSI